MYVAIILSQPASPTYDRHIVVGMYYAAALFVVDGALCLMCHVGLKFHRLRAVGFVLGCRLMCVPFSTQDWFLVVSAMFVGFAIVVGGGIARALFPVQSVRDAVAPLLAPSGTRTANPTTTVGIALSVAALYGGATIAVYFDADNLHGDSIIPGLTGTSYLWFGIVTILYVPEYVVTRTLWRGFDYHLPAAAPSAVRFSMTWLRYALEEDLKAMWERGCCLCCGGSRHDGGGDAAAMMSPRTLNAPGKSMEAMLQVMRVRTCFDTYLCVCVCLLLCGCSTKWMSWA